MCWVGLYKRKKRPLVVECTDKSVGKFVHVSADFGPKGKNLPFCGGFLLFIVVCTELYFWAHIFV